jgi:5-methylcytosine-specific restriction enzyme A
MVGTPNPANLMAFLRPCRATLPDGQPCGQLTRDRRSLCPTHATTTARGYNHRWATHASATIADWRAEHGDWCPGWQIPGHHATDLVVDHDIGVLCRQCNSRKAATHDKQRRNTPHVG